ncbi:MAG: AAA family ATPase, partial [Jaaginema sp. PMC 1080.18]|nr:AAA family ATPase [Jaaginema sp. PMC 1080.18]
LINNSEIVASKGNSEKYGIEELSDGERNALLISANVITAKPGTLIIIDEPEHHLHRSISSPLLSNLFKQRNDCAFIISTHDVELPLDNRDSDTLLIRGCTHNGSNIANWEADLVQSDNPISDDIKRDILGARKKILFVEGNESSLDKTLYSLIFPNISIVPKASCLDVVQTVSSIKKSDALHWISAFGIIDGDGNQRSDTELDELREKGIYALSVYSVESIYYHPNIQELIANRKADILGGDFSDYLEKAKNEAIDSIRESNIEYLAAKVAEKAILKKVSNHLPTRQSIQAKERIDIDKHINVEELFTEECNRLRTAIANKDLMKIISIYPIRESQVLKKICEGLRFQSRDDYERAVRKLLLDKEPEALNIVKSFFESLVNDMNEV